jgi:CHAT domain-containing protein/tetratricopeptide (TPR) repeat protein
MGCRIGRSLLAAVLMTLLASSAPPPSLEQAYANARVVFDRGDDALPILDAALADAGNRNDAIVWRLRVLRALAFLRHGSREKALADVTPELPPGVRDTEVAIDRLLILGMLSKNPESARYFDEARRLARAKHPKKLAEVLYPQAKSESDVREALRAAKRYGSSIGTQARILGTLGNFAADDERFDEAIDFAQKARTLLGDRDQSLVHQTEGNLGWYYNELGDRDSAEEHLRNAITIATKVHADANRVVYLLQLGESEMSRRDLEGARREFFAARDLAATLTSGQTGSVLLDIAQVTFLGGDVAAAREINASAMQSNLKVENVTAVLRSRILDARIAWRAQRLDEARDGLVNVLAEAKTKALRWEAESWLAQVYAARDENTAAEKHFRNAIATVDAARNDIQTTELRFSVPDLAAQMYDAYIEFLVGQGRDVDALRIAELNRARTLAEELQPEREGQFEPASKAREAGVVALSYRLGRARSFLWVITPASVKCFDLPPAETIERAVNDYAKSIERRRSGALGEDLYRMLVAPAANLLRGVSRVAIIPDGRLAALNFETLVVPASHHYWIEDVTIESAPSLRLLSRPQTEAEHGRLLMIVNDQPPDRAFPPLLYAGDEARRVKAHFDDAKTLAASQATPKAYLASKPESYSFLHFVAHGVATQTRPLDSAIILARDSDGYKLYAREILAHRLKARLVTISSCFGAGRRAYQGEGLVGLAWAFLGAGAHEVIAALWEVNDRATPDLMDTMYAAIRAGHDPVDALRIAKLKMLRSGTLYRKPFFWAPFVVYTGR